MGTFADSFDFYGSQTDSTLGWWDSGAGPTLSTGRFTGSNAATNAVNSATTPCLAKSSGSNDATHHVNVSFIQTTALSGTNNMAWITLYDGTNAQCSIVFRSDGAILLVSGASSGATLGTIYTGAFVANAWANFEFEITINNTTGAWHVRKDGVGSDSHVDTSLNTRAGSTNNYANKIAFGFTTSSPVQKLDDFVWDYNSTTWRGDGRMLQLMPVSNTGTVQFTAGTIPAITLGAATGTLSRAVNVAAYTPFTPPYDCTLSSMTINANASATANCKFALFADGGGSTVGTLVSNGSSNVLSNPVAGLNTVTWSTPPAMTGGTQYWLGSDQDATVVYKTGGAGITPTATVTYASFPTNSPTTASNNTSHNMVLSVVATSNYQLVDETTQDGATTFISDTTVGHLDIYNLADLPYTPTTIGFVQARGIMWKSDAGAKTGGIAINSGTVVTSGTLVLSTSSLTAIVPAQTVDPNTGSAWAAAAVNALTMTGSVVA